MKKRKNLLKMFLLSVTMLMLMLVPAFADEVNRDVKDARSGVLQIRLWYEDKNGDSDYIGGGSAFLINDDTIVTCHHVVHVYEGSEQEQYVKQKYPNYDASNIKYKVVIRNDVTLDAKLIQESEISDFAILRLEQPINNRKVLALNTDEVSETQQVYALGFPDTVAAFQNQNTYTYEDVTVEDGRVTKMNESDGVKYVQHSAMLSSGYSGGPLVNSSGVVVAMNRATVMDNTLNVVNNYSVAISEITAILDDMGIEYTPSGFDTPSVAPQTTKEPDTEPATTQEQEITEPETTEQVVDKPVPAHMDDEEEDEEEGKILGLSKTMFIAVVAVIVVVIIIIIILIIALGGKKKKAAQAVPQRPMPQQRPVSPSGMGPQGMAPQPPRAPQYSNAPNYGNEGAGETTVLNEGAGETTVLGGGAAAGAKTLVRIKNGEKIVVNRPEFLIGKERRRVDYCISDNNSVSRVHAKLVNRNGQLFIIDMGATNGTFVNGTKLSQNQEVRLSVGDRFKLADDEFQVQS